MGAGSELLPAPELEPARLQTVALERLALHRRDLAGKEARMLGGERALETPRGEGINLRPRDLVLSRQRLGGVAHGGIGSGIEQRLPEKVLEVDRAHAEAAHGVG